MPNHPRYGFNASSTLENPSSRELVVSISRGTVLEPNSTHLSYQSAVVARDYVFVLNPRETRSVILECECWNRQLSPPRQINGTLTQLKGNVDKTTNVWKVSSHPSSHTVLVSPSQDAHVFSALANVAPSLAKAFLGHAITAVEDGDDVEDLVQKFSTISNAFTPKDKREMCRVARAAKVNPLVNATALRAFVIRNGGPTDRNLAAIIALCTDVCAVTSHRLASQLYRLAAELQDLIEQEGATVIGSEREDLTSVIRQKFLDLLDALPRVDDIEWN